MRSVPPAPGTPEATGRNELTVALTTPMYPVPQPARIPAGNAWRDPGGVIPTQTLEAQTLPEGMNHGTVKLT